MEKKEKEKEKKSVFERLKTNNIKKTSRLVVIVFFVFALVFATITNLGFKSFDIAKYFSNMLIMAGILIFGLVMGESGGIDYYRGLENGTYKTNVAEYNNFNASIKSTLINFDQWFSEQLPKELENKKIRFLVKHGIKIKTAKRIIKYCKLKDLDLLIQNDATKMHDNELNKDIFIEKIEEYQVDAVKWVLEGKIILDAPNSYYFTTLYNDELNDVAILEQGNAIIKKRKKVKNLNRATRIGTSVVFSALWASLTVYEMMSGDDLGAYMNLISRIAGLFTSMLSGYMSAKVMVNLDARQVKNKYEVLFLYHSDIISGSYVVKDEQELLKDKYEKQVKKEEEAKKNIIDPTNPKDTRVEIIQAEPKRLENKSNQIEHK